ncbi:GH13308 [Drosophila grimshawi]|uniref:GH13308 n=1 Tax=Drosophila grimshawi TaxID=7222 RepID=B4JPY3_DROGR|nr:GH13308 [Drosophila grimshawi]
MTLLEINAKRQQPLGEPSLSEMIKECIGYRTNPTDQICLSCILSVENAFQFKRRCEQSQQYFCSGMDCAVIPLARHKDYSLVQTVDFFYPLVDDPETMGRIALANVLSDVYAVGVTDIDKLELLISAPSNLTEKQRDIVVPLIMKGFQRASKDSGCFGSITIKSVIINPWCIVGGIATSVCRKQDIILPWNAKAGDVLVLTKPLGTQLATSAHIWQKEKNEKYQTLLTAFTDIDILDTFQMAIKSMTYLNRNAALLMHKYEAHAATDVTGFGLLGHAKNLVEFQKQSLLFKIHKLPIIKNVRKFGELVGQSAKLTAGKAVETSGGLLICLTPKAAEEFCEEFTKITKGAQKVFVIGEVADTNVSTANLAENVEYIEVTL